MYNRRRWEMVPPPLIPNSFSRKLYPLQKTMLWRFGNGVVTIVSVIGRNIIAEVCSAQAVEL
jgi:hypothetical protein